MIAFAAETARQAFTWMSVAIYLLYVVDALTHDHAAGSSDIPSNTTLRLLSHNVFMRPPLIKNNESDYKDARLAYIIKRILQRSDIITLQEMFDFFSSRRDKLLAAAASGVPRIDPATGQAMADRPVKFSGQVYSPSKHIWDLRIDGGLVILSRYPIVKSAVLQFSGRGIDSDWLAAKGALYARIDIGGGNNLHLFTTHTQASYKVTDSLDLDAVKVRFRQFTELPSFIKSNLADGGVKVGEAVVLQGDFNVDSRSCDPANNGQDAAPPLGAVVGACGKCKQASTEYAAVMQILRTGKLDVHSLPQNHWSNCTTPKSAKVSHAFTRTGRSGINAALHVPDSYHAGTDPEIHVRSASSDSSVVLPRDDGMLQTMNGEHAVTYGDSIRDASGSVIPRETVLTDHADYYSCMKIDHILRFHVTEDSVFLKGESATAKASRSTNFGDAVVANTFVDKKADPSEKFTQLSDHYGVEHQITIV
ncbi:hypothetical protein GQ42DRAFT_165798 [Ramicandelaber brevisporus]|nr:hypothetical protein GQ42DRAFT_165798 [Ramicandelaber brevisporus]